MGGPAGLGMRPHEQSVKFEARWVSAQTMREAIVREAVLGGELTEAKADRDIAQAPAAYEISLLGDDMTPFSKLSDADIVKATYLEMKNVEGEIGAGKRQNRSLSRRHEGIPHHVQFSQDCQRATDHRP